MVTSLNSKNFIIKYKTYSDVYFLNSNNEIDELKKNWPSGCDIFIIDDYNKNYDYEKQVSKWAKHVFVIDDYISKKHHCNFLINQNLNNRIIYKKNYIKLTGPMFALINPNYSLDRLKIDSDYKNLNKSYNILVSMGFTDPYKLSVPVIKVISEIDPNINIHLTLNKAVFKINEINYQITKLNIKNKIFIYDDLTYLGKLMIKCDLCIGTLGVSSWERCSVGLPTIGIQVSTNQNQIFKTLNNAELKLNLKRNNKSLFSDLEEILRNTYKNISFLKKMRLKSLELCDGNGVSRVGMLSLNYFDDFIKNQISLKLPNEELSKNNNEFTEYNVYLSKKLVGSLKINASYKLKNIELHFNIKNKNIFEKINGIFQRLLLA